MVFVILSLSVLAAFCIWPYDQEGLRLVHTDSPSATELARFLSKWGDYPTYSVPLAVVIALASLFFRQAANRSYWRRVALVCFLGASIAGLFNDAFRLTLGRPRPFVLQDKPGLVDRFYGPELTWYGDYQSFPSGHAATAFGTAAALFVVNPPLGVACTAYATGVIWARMDLRRHYPSDITVGTTVGIVFGLLVGWGAGRRKFVVRSS